MAKNRQPQHRGTRTQPHRHARTDTVPQSEFDMHVAQLRVEIDTAVEAGQRIREEIEDRIARS